MAGYVRRFTYVPTLEVIREIEGLVIIDLAPPAPATGAGTGTVLLVGEFEDGYFATEEDAQGAVEVFGSNDYAYKFGSFGYTYSGVKANNPSARKSLGEFWNGNGFLKSYKLRASRLLVSRVDTNVGEVTFSPLVTIKGEAGPWALTNAMVLSATSNTGTGLTAALTSAAAAKVGSGSALATIVAGDAVYFHIDALPPILVTFGAADTTISAVVSRINSTIGAVVASNNAGELNLTALNPGSASTLWLSEAVSGGTVITKLGHSGGVASGSGNVANINSVTASEVVTLVNASASMTSANVKARVGSDGLLWVYDLVSSLTTTLEIDAGTGGMAAALGFPIDESTSLADNEAGTIPAGSRVQASGIAGSEWVVMQTLDIAAADPGPFTVKIRPGLDDGTHVGATAGQINTLVDCPTFANFAVANAGTVSAALSEAQKDARYIEALDATLNELGPCREANYLLIARRSDAVVREGRANALTATSIGFFGRKYITRDALGSTPDHSISDVGSRRSDRVFYAPLALKVLVPQIAERGTAGGSGFTADGVITVAPDGPLCTLCAMLPPEENPGQQTGLIDDFFAINAYGSAVNVDTYKAFRRNGLCAPRIDRVAGTIFQSGVTTSLLSGEQTMARRKMADFIQDSSIGLFLPYAKRIARASVRAKVLGLWNQFLGGLESKSNPDKSRIYQWSTDDGVNAGNTAATLALGVYYILTTVKTHPSLDFMVLQTEIGENAVITKTL